jgi:hypothetical protein
MLSITPCAAASTDLTVFPDGAALPELLDLPERPMKERSLRIF